MNFTEISVKRPVATLMAFLAVLVMGVVAYMKLPLDIMPKMELPTLTVITVYPGASAQEVESQITEKLETVLAGAEGLKEIKSKSKENVSFISLEYNWNTNITEAANNTRDLIELVKRQLPGEANSPIIFKVNSSMLPVLIYGVTAKENYYGIDQIVNEDIAGPIRKLDGVGTVIWLAQPEREIKIILQPEKLKAYNLSISQISTILKAENISIPGGNVKSGIYDFAVEVPGDLTTTEELGAVALVNFNDKIIKLRDVAEIKDSFKETDEFARSENGPSVAIMVQKQSGANTLEVVNSVRSEMAKLKGELPADVEVSEILATDEIISQSIGNLSETLIYAFIIVIFVVLFFLRDWKSSAIIALTIPFSLITAFIVMFILGYTINIFSLMALVIAIGMVVDDAIVVLEYINQKLKKGLSPMQAAIEGTKEMGLAITASTTTNVMVFIPIVFIGGIVGIMFKQLAIITTVTLIASLITALSLTPMLSSKMFKQYGADGAPEKHSRFYRWSERMFESVENSYKKLIGVAIRHKFATLAITVVILLVSVYFARFIGSDYIPEFDAGDIAVVFETEVGTSAAETDKVAQKVMDVIKQEVPEMVPGSLAAISGQTRDGILSTVGFSEGKNISTVLCHLTLPNNRERSAKEIGEKLRKRIREIPEIERFHINAGSILSAALLGNSKPIEVVVSGNNFDELNQAALQIEDHFKNSPYLADVETTIDNGKREIVVHINREKASNLGLNAAMAGLQIRQSIYGTEGGTISDNGESYDITIQYDLDKRNSINDVGNIQVTNLRGERIPVSAFADIEIGNGKLEISRLSQQRYVLVKANLNGISLGEASGKAKEYLRTATFPKGISTELSGQVKNQSESFSDLYLIFILGILLVYMVMAAQFESFKHPFIIMLALPFTIIGVVWAFIITGLTLSVTTFIGIIMLIGIVVKNGIILVDYTNQLRRKGYELAEAIKESGRSRLRPVLMTTLTAICGMIPMALSTGMGKEMFSPLGITLIGGLLASTLITLVFVPALYATFHLKTLRKESHQKN
jgi:HAE1 family hydrophobic/amphiphilic exporter-1